MAMNTDSTPTTTVLYVIVVVVAVLVASVLAPVVWSATRGSPDVDRSGVAVITLRGGTSSANVAAISEDLRQARSNESTEAVVVRIDSSGGAVTSSEEFYLAMNRTAAEMPVVAYVEGLAASGGYFGIAPADAIYVKPSSYVGSIGVIASITPSLLEQQNDVNSQVINTGPDKAITTVDRVREELELLQNAFVGTVMAHRSDDLELNRSQVAHAGIYRGTEAVENGFADRIGSLESAIDRAAEEAAAIDGDRYEVFYEEPPSTQGAIVLADERAGAGNDSVVSVDRAGDRETDFVRPVRFYAVYGVPADAIVDREVTVNATG